jgi:hypothetical protein
MIWVVLAWLAAVLFPRFRFPIVDRIHVAFDSMDHVMEIAARFAHACDLALETLAWLALIVLALMVWRAFKSRPWSGTPP